MNINKIENHSQIKTRMPQDLVFCSIRVFIDFLSISLTLSSLPSIIQTKTKQFLQLEITLVILSQSHTVIITRMNKQLSRQITVQHKIKCIFPTGNYGVISCKVLQFRLPHNTGDNCLSQITCKFRTEKICCFMPRIHIKSTRISYLIITDIHKSIRQWRS